MLPRLLLFLAALAAAAAFAAPASAETYCVHTFGSCEAGALDYDDDLQLALGDAGVSGEANVVRIGPGKYTGTFVYDGQSPLSIEGAGPDTTLAGPESADAVLTTGRADVSRVRILLPSASDSIGVEAGEGSTLADLVVDAKIGLGGRMGVFLRGTSSLVRSTVDLRGEVGVGTQADGKTTTVADSVIHGATGVQAFGGATGTTFVRRTTLDSDTALLAEGTEISADNVVALGSADGPTLHARCAAGAAGASTVTT